MSNTQHTNPSCESHIEHHESSTESEEDTTRAEQNIETEVGQDSVMNDEQDIGTEVGQDSVIEVNQGATADSATISGRIRKRRYKTVHELREQYPEQNHQMSMSMSERLSDAKIMKLTEVDASEIEFL